MRILRRLSMWVLVSIGIMLGGASVVLAGNDNTVSTRLTISAPSQVAFGSPATLGARLQDEIGQPIGKATVHFYSPATFMSGASGLMRIGDAVTNEQGVAIMDYVSRRNGEIEIMAEFQGDTHYGPSQGVVTIAVQGNHQLYNAEAGIQVPYISKWVLVTILSIIWGTYVFVVSLVLRIALAPPE